MQVDHLWAPWRMEYLKDDRASGCPFCELPREEPSEKNLVLYRDDDIFVVMNKFPYNVGHLLVIPRAHHGDPSEVTPAVWARLALALQNCVGVLRDVLEPQGFNSGMNVGAVGGAGIPQHLHWHLIPRWGGDTNFMPLIAETKTLPTHNATVYRRLLPLFQDFAARLAEAKMKL